MIALAHITKYSNIFERYLWIFEYVCTPSFLWSEYSKIFVFQFFYICIRISNIRPEIFEYSNIFEYSLCSVSRHLSQSWWVFVIFNEPSTVLAPTNNAHFLQWSCLFIIVSKTSKEPPETTLQNKKHITYNYIQKVSVSSHVTIVFTITATVLPVSW